MVVANPTSEPSSVVCISEGAVRALRVPAHLSFELKQYISVSQGCEEKLGIRY